MCDIPINKYIYKETCSSMRFDIPVIRQNTSFVRVLGLDGCSWWKNMDDEIEAEMCISIEHITISDLAVNIK